MGSRRQVRESLNLNVSLCGTDTNGQAFVERVRTVNISHDGALLEGVRNSVRNGDIVILRREDSTGRFRVIWEQSSSSGWRLGLSRLFSANAIDDPDCAIWVPDVYERPRKQARRQMKRYQCEIAAELRIKGIQTPMWVTSVNLGEGGCAVQTLVSVPHGTELSIAFWLDDIKVWVQGIVVTSLYGLGTGITFTGISRQSRQFISEYLTRRGVEVADRRGSGVKDPGEIEFFLQREPEHYEEFTVATPTKGALLLE